MSDLVKRLREWADPNEFNIPERPRTLLNNAADEIEKLAEKCERYRAALEFECGKRCAEGLNPCNARKALEDRDE